MKKVRSQEIFAGDYHQMTEQIEWHVENRAELFFHDRTE